MTYDGSMPPADGREYWWSNVADAWIPADEPDVPEDSIIVARIDQQFVTQPVLGVDDFHHQEP